MHKHIVLTTEITKKKLSIDVWRWIALNSTLTTIVNSVTQRYEERCYECAQCYCIDFVLFLKTKISCYQCIKPTNNQVYRLEIWNMVLNEEVVKYTNSIFLEISAILTMLSTNHPNQWSSARPLYLMSKSIFRFFRCKSDLLSKTLRQKNVACENECWLVTWVDFFGCVPCCCQILVMISHIWDVVILTYIQWDHTNCCSNHFSYCLDLDSVSGSHQSTQFGCKCVETLKIFKISTKSAREKQSERITLFTRANNNATKNQLEIVSTLLYSVVVCWLSEKKKKSRNFLTSSNHRNAVVIIRTDLVSLFKWTIP